MLLNASLWKYIQNLHFGPTSSPASSRTEPASLQPQPACHHRRKAGRCSPAPRLSSSSCRRHRPVRPPGFLHPAQAPPRCGYPVSWMLLPGVKRDSWGVWCSLGDTNITSASQILGLENCILGWACLLAMIWFQDPKSWMLLCRYADG